MNMREVEDIVESKMKEITQVSCPKPDDPGSPLPFPADYDRTGKPDYALESAGGSIVTSRCTETYSKGYSVSRIFGIPVWWSRPGPREILNPEVVPGRCWAMTGTTGSVVVRLSMPVVVTSVTYEHIPVQISVHGNIDSAPREFEVVALRSENDLDGALLGRFEYDRRGRPWQTFQLPNKPANPIQYVEIKVLSNWGNPEYTCLYRWRVHGDLNRT
jgi:SUN domain-containing protein 1/2